MGGILISCVVLSFVFLLCLFCFAVLFVFCFESVDEFTADF